MFISGYFFILKIFYFFIKVLDDGDIDFEKIYVDGNDILIDDAYRKIISECNGNAYYQEFYKWDDEAEEFIED